MKELDTKNKREKRLDRQIDITIATNCCEGRRVTKESICVQVKQSVIHELRKIEMLRTIYHKLNSKD